MRHRPFASRVPWIGLALTALLGIGCHNVHFEMADETGDIGIYDDLFAISVVDGSNAVAAGYWGSVYTTADGGETWERSDSGTKRLIYDVSMANPNQGWAVGQIGTILRTEDGGKSWAVQDNAKVEQGPHLFGVHAIDADRAWVIGEWGTRLFTSDGGKTWQDESLTIDETHPQFVWLAPVEQDRVRRGEKVFEDVGLNDVYCRPLPSQRCWIIGEFGYIFYSDDHGGTWSRSEITGDLKMDPIPMGYDDLEVPDTSAEALRNFSGSISDLAHLNVEINPRLSQREVDTLMDGDDPSPIFELVEARARNVQSIVEEAGILQDRMRLRGSPPWDYEDYLEDDPEFLTRYLNGRVSEEPGVLVGVAQNPYLFTVRFSGEDQGLIAGLGGVMLRSEDGGRSWAYLTTDRKQAFFSVYAVPDLAIAVGEKGMVRVSKDAGRTWVRPESGFPNIFTFMRDVRFTPDGKTGFIVGQRGMILRSDDGGASWNQVLPPKSSTDT